MEHDALTLWIDLVLLKRDVFRHLLYNRGTGARRLSDDSKRTTDGSVPEGAARDREKNRWLLILRLGSVLVAVDAFIRWTHLSSGTLSDPALDIATWNREALECYFRVLVGCLVETVGFHTGVTLASFLVLRSLAFFRAWRVSGAQQTSGLRLQFRYSHIPLTILYSSLTKFFLLFLLTIWTPQVQPPATLNPLPPQYNATHFFSNPVVVRALTVLDDDKLDREWIIRNVLGGMATGFGLRVVLDCHPVFTTTIVLAGWAVKTALAKFVSGWVSAGIGGDGITASEMWLEYSIP